MKVGFIGTGSMGTMLVSSFIEAEVFSPAQMTIYNRTPAKAEKILHQFPDLKIAVSLEELIRTSDAIFICVRPVDYRGVLETMSSILTSDQVVISITSPVMIADLERWISGKVIKMIPSITNAAHGGATLVTFGNRLNHDEQKFWMHLFAMISQPIEIDEKYVRIASDLTSCGPAFFSLLLQNFIESAVQQTGISKESATFLVTQMITGLGRLISTEKFTLESLQERVCVPGGVTGVGLAVIYEELGPLFSKVFVKTHEKFAEDLKLTTEWLK